MIGHHLPVRTAVDEGCDPAAIAQALACARDRPPRTERGEMGRVSYVQMEWKRLDSPRKEASLRVSALSESLRLRQDELAMQQFAVDILEGATNADASFTQALAWHVDLGLLGILAARADETPRRLSQTDHAHATAATPWSPAQGQRSPPRGEDGFAFTLDAAAIAAALPELPPVVLVRTADINARGAARVVVGALHGSSRFRDVDPMTVLRAHARFPGLFPPEA